MSLACPSWGQAMLDELGALIGISIICFLGNMLFVASGFSD